MVDVLADFTLGVYTEMRAQAIADARKSYHVPPTLAAVVPLPALPDTSGSPVLALHNLEVLDARQAMHQMRAHVLREPATYAFVFVSTGTVIVERDASPPQIAPALLCLWVTADAAGGESYLLQSSPLTGVTVKAPRPAPDSVCDTYRKVFDPSAPLPRPRGGVLGVDR